MMLRIQRERIAEMPCPLDDYAPLSAQRAPLGACAATPSSCTPDPTTAASSSTTVLDDAGSRYVLQVHNGVFVRMAVLDFLVNNGVNETRSYAAAASSIRRRLDAMSRRRHRRTASSARSARARTDTTGGSSTHRRDRRAGLHRHARPLARARLHAQRNDRHRNRGGGAGGFTAVACMPNTRPGPRRSATSSRVSRQAGTDGLAASIRSRAITRGRKGTELCDYAALARAGAVARSQTTATPCATAAILIALRRREPQGDAVMNEGARPGWACRQPRARRRRHRRARSVDRRRRQALAHRARFDRVALDLDPLGAQSRHAVPAR